MGCVGWGMTEGQIKKGLWAAGAMNIAGVLIFSRGFTNAAINEADPVVMSNFGLVMIMVWGLAYLGAATVVGRAEIKWLAAAFAVEKLVYGVVWLAWLGQHGLGELYARDFFAGIFFSIYGLNDLGFMLFFARVFFGSKPHGVAGVG